MTSYIIRLKSQNGMGDCAICTVWRKSGALLPDQSDIELKPLK